MPKTGSDHVRSWEELKEGRIPKGDGGVLLCLTVILFATGIILIFTAPKFLELYAIIISLFGAVLIALGSVLGKNLRHFLMDVIKQLPNEDNILLYRCDVIHEIINYHNLCAGEDSTKILQTLNTKKSNSMHIKNTSNRLSERDLALMLLEVSSKTGFGTILVLIGGLASAILVVLRMLGKPVG